LSGLDKVVQLVARHVGSRPIRLGGSEVSSEPAAQVVSMLRAQGSERSKAHGQRKMKRE
jgi:hypothetical protein